MFLRSLTLKGFKSFADTTTLEFVPGISVVVGPNGSGKSNLVDAISWVLGEQGPRSLRGGQMADVIFAGSPQRPALGMAEVHLVIDNEAGKIPVPLSELEISRAVFRSGDSEYRIGKELCRLMDIQELLSDSGIGRALHTIVGQGQLDDVLTARPEERRQFIEEAAGIAKHRRRKERAQRKLASLDQDLLRLQDVMAELRRRLRPLQQQAEVARKHEKLSAEAEEVAWRLAAARLRALLDAREAKLPVWEEGLRARAEQKRRLEALDETIDRLTKAVEEATRDRAQAEQRFRETRDRKAQAEATFRKAQEREASAKAKLASESVRAARLEALHRDLARAEDDLNLSEAALRERQQVLDEAESLFRRAEAERREAEEERRRLLEKAAAHRAEIETVRRSLSSYERERDRLQELLTAVAEQVEGARTDRSGLERRIEELDGKVRQLEERRSGLRDERNRLAGRLSELEEALRAFRTKEEVLAARRAMLSESPGSRFVAENPGRAAGLLGDMVRAQDGWGAALRAALGAYADAVVYESFETAVLDAKGARGATLVFPLDRIPPPTLQSERSMLSVVRADRRAAPSVAALLREVYLADSLDDAVRRHRANPAAAFATKEGVLVGPLAVKTASDREGDAKAVEEELEGVRREIAAAESALRPIRRRLSDLDGEIEGATVEAEALDREIAEAAEAASRAETEVAAAAKEEALLRQRVAALDEAASVWRDTLESAEEAAPPDLPPLPPPPEPPVGARVALEAARRERETLEERVRSLRRERDDLLAATPGSIRAEVEAAEVERARAEAVLREAEKAHEAASQARDGAVAAEREATAAEAEANRTWRDAAAELDRLRERFEAEDRERGDLERRIGDAERLLREGHGRDPAEAVAALAGDDTIAALERKSELVARRLALLGKVNLLAGGEYEALQERYEFMQRELNDVKKARRDLLEVIRRVDDEVISMFDAAFRDVAREFEHLFKILFPGGEGRLVLTDPANLLETGVEVEARPGRKRVKRLSLLSGGERALTALGFLFAIFRARPSPFYLLDEVEAALDDINLHRFLQLIKEFARDSQVIIVTHQKRTMEVADMMYGVSMNKDGSTRIVCQKLHAPGASVPSPPRSLEATTGAAVSGTPGE